MIHVCYSLRDERGRYTKFVGTSMTSLFENASDSVVVHVIHDSTVPKSELGKLFEITNAHHQRIGFYNIDELAPDLLNAVKQAYPKIETHWASIAGLYRLFIPIILPREISRVIYIDADTIVTLDINELWNVNLNGKPLAAVPESQNGIEQRNLEIFVPVKIGRVKWTDYFNSGLLFLDLNLLRAHSDKDLFSYCLRFLQQNPSCTHPDQDALNAVFANQYVQLPLKFNRFVSRARESQFDKQTIKREIYHYITTTLDIHLDDVYNRLWFSYFIKTPFFSMDCFDHIAKSYDTYTNYLFKRFGSTMDTFRSLLTLMTSRKRCFISERSHLDTLKKFFDVQPSETVFNALSNNIADAIISKITSENIRYIIFIMTREEVYFSIRHRFLAAGLKENIDFVNCYDLIGLKISVNPAHLAVNLM